MGDAMSMTGLLHSPIPVFGHSSAPRTAGLKPFGAPSSNTVPETEPGAGGVVVVVVLHELVEPPLSPELPLDPGQHVLELLLELDALLPLEPELPHDMEVVDARRLLSPVRPRPDAISGRTVTNKTKPAAAMTATRARCFQVFMPTPFSLFGPISMSAT